MKKLFIIGSCVTRDALEPKFTKGSFKIEKYYSRTSLARVKYGESTISHDDINLTSNFQRSAIINDFKIAFIENIKSIEFDYLIIDLIDDRFGLIKLNDQDSYVTYSDELKKAKLIDLSKKHTIHPNSKEYIEAWEEGLKLILNSVDPQKVIINNVYWSKTTDADKPFINIERAQYCKNILDQQYSIAKKYIPPENFINYNESIFIGAENHKWGRSPFHYVDEVYQYFIKRLTEITNN